MEDKYCYCDECYTTFDFKKRMCNCGNSLWGFDNQEDRDIGFNDCIENRIEELNLLKK